MEMQYPLGFVIIYTDTFHKEYRKLPLNIKKLAEKKGKDFSQEPV